MQMDLHMLCVSKLALVVEQILLTGKKFSPVEYKGDE